MPTSARGINDAGQTVGYFIDVDGTVKGFLTIAPSGGGYVNVPIPSTEYLVAPGYAGTLPKGINNAGFVSGFLLDTSGRAVSGFVAVPPVSNQISALAAAIASFNLPGGIPIVLNSKLEGAQFAIDNGNTALACRFLEVLIHLARVLSDNKLTTDEADGIILDATVIQQSLGCSG